MKEAVLALPLGDPDVSDPDGPDPLECFRAVLQLQSAMDPSLVVDVADLWDAPASVLTWLGERAETDLLLALRRGARAWAPAGT